MKTKRRFLGILLSLTLALGLLSGMSMTALAALATNTVTIKKVVYTDNNDGTVSAAITFSYTGSKITYIDPMIGKSEGTYEYDLDTQDALNLPEGWALKKNEDGSYTLIANPLHLTGGKGKPPAGTEAWVGVSVTSVTGDEWSEASDQLKIIVPEEGKTVEVGNIPCVHSLYEPEFVDNKDGETHQKRCSNCHEVMEKSQSHNLYTREISACAKWSLGATETYCTQCDAVISTEANLVDLGDTTVTGLSIDPDHEYTRTEVEGFGLAIKNDFIERDLTKEEFTLSVKAKEKNDKPGWTVTFEPMEGKSTGRKRDWVLGCSHDLYEPEFADNKDGKTHQKICGNCHEVLEKSQSHNLDTREIPASARWPLGATETYCTQCDAVISTEANLVDLGDTTVTGLSVDPDHEYTRTEVEGFGLKYENEIAAWDLTKEEFTISVEAKVKDDLPGWTFTFEPVEGKSTGEKTGWVLGSCFHDLYESEFADNKDGKTHQEICGNCHEVLEKKQSHNLYTREIPASTKWPLGATETYCTQCNAVISTESNMINLSNAEVTKAPVANELTYTGSAQELITAGEAAGGELQYVLGDNNTTAPESGWSASIPAKTDAGTYYVWYKVVGDANHYDTTPACVEATIRQTSTDPVYRNEWVNGQWYDKNGKADYKPKGSWKRNAKGWRYGDTSGWFAKNKWQKIDGKWYFFDNQGLMEKDAYRNGWYVTADGSWDGKDQVTGWVEDNEGWKYYTGSSSHLKKCWKMIDGKWYFFKASGYAAQNEFVQGWWLGNNCAWNDPVHYGWHKSGSKWWYGVKDGWFAKSKSYTIDGKSYAFDKKGYTE